MKRRIYNKLKWIVIIVFLFNGNSCSDYLNVIPDNTPTVDHAFNKRYQAEGFLYGCYSFLPDFAEPGHIPSFFAGDEAWLFDQADFNKTIWTIAKGEQGTESPIANYWASKQDSYSLNRGIPLFTAINDCNIFLENIDKVIDLDEWEKDQWIAEVKCLKAYYHFWLLRMYGPIPILDDKIEVYTSPEEIQVYREPVDKVVDYIANLFDEASIDLPLQIEDITNDLGRFTKPIALALKAQTLTLAASPLFNGNPDYAEFSDNRGIPLFSQQYDATKWVRAAEALKVAIDIAHTAGHQLFDFSKTSVASSLSSETVAAMQVRGAVTERWNEEIIWGSSNSNTLRIQQISLPGYNEFHNVGGLLFSYAPTLRVVKQFYSKNGVPIEEDREWENTNLFEIIPGDASHKKYIGEGYETIRLHFDREPRFYGAISFDGGTFYGYGNNSDNSLKVVKLRFASTGRFLFDKHSSTGYLVKKVLHRMTTIGENAISGTYYRYAFPIIRLADLYLMYAEALNESKDSPDGEVYEYIDLVRVRTGLNGVVESWQNHSNQPEKPRTKEGMREIIRRERMNELAFEGVRFWDLRRWKLSEEYMNTPILGLNILAEDAAGFYQTQELFSPSFTTKDYLWPIRQGNLLKNKNLVQNPGW